MSRGRDVRGRCEREPATDVIAACLGVFDESFAAPCGSHMGTGNGRAMRRVLLAGVASGTQGKLTRQSSSVFFPTPRVA